jgi:hypothetical protein
MTEQIFELNRRLFDLSRHDAQQFDANKIYDLPVDTAVAFSNHKCIYKHSIERQQRKFIRELDFLAPFLAPGEMILYVTIGCLPASFVEQVLTGVLLGPLKRILLVVTNKRIFHIPTSSGLEYRNSISHIAFADCRQIRVGFSSLIADYKSGRTERFRCISWAGRKKLKSILKNVSFEGRADLAMERTHLCPACTKPLIKGCYTCPNCSLKFKTHTCAAILSLLFPGGGYFYTRHPFIGIIAGVMELLFAFLLTVSSIIFAKHYAEDPRYLSQAVAVCAIMLLYQKMVTCLFSGKCVDEFIPKKWHVDVKVEKTNDGRKSTQPQDMLASNWRSI